MKLIKFTLASPLQSWGEDARWDTRSTSVIPTKSAVIGLLGCCFGYPRGDQRLNQLNSKLNMAVRADRPGRIMTDFQTVQGTDGVLLNASGKPRTGGNTIITPKQYLQDAWFTVFLWGEEGILNECFQAMLHPRWPVYLGRKSCIPSIPVKPEWLEAQTVEEAVSQFSETERKKLEKHVRVEMDISNEISSGGDLRMITRRDTLIRADHNEYAIRNVQTFSIPTGGDPACT